MHNDSPHVHVHLADIRTHEATTANIRTHKAKDNEYLHAQGNLHMQNTQVPIKAFTREQCKV